MVECGCNSRDGFLTVRGYAEHAQRNYSIQEGVDRATELARLGVDVSVSGSTPPPVHWGADFKIDQQYQRFHNGS